MQSQHLGTCPITGSPVNPIALFNVHPRCMPLSA